MEYRGRIRLLACLVIFTAEDCVISSGAPIDSEIIVRIIRVPKARFGNKTLRDFRAERVGRIERQLRLQKGGGDRTGSSHQRIVSRENDIAAPKFVAAGGHHEWIAIDAFHFSRLKHVRAIARNFPHEFSQVLSRMKDRLMRELHAGSRKVGDLWNVLNGYSQLGGSLRLPLKLFRMLAVRTVRRRMQISGRPFEVAGNILSSDTRYNLIDGGSAGIPHRFRAVGAKFIDQLRESQIGHRGQMRGRIPGVNGGAAVALD